MKKIIKLLVIIIITIFIVYLYSRYVETNSLKVHHQTINSSLIGKGKEVKILQFSDMHISYYFDEKDIKKVVEKINEEKPDIVFFTGDLIDEYNDYKNTNNIDNIWLLLSDIKAPLGKYAVYGNHDYGGGAQKAYKTIMENSGFKILKNEKVSFDEYNINIIGMDDSIFGKLEKEKLINMLDKGRYNIVLSHEPDVIEYLLEYNIDLFLSGHSHGGQVNLPFVKVQPILAKKYTRGIYNFNNFRQTTLYVNVGLGTSQIPLRFMAPPELAVFVLTNSER